MLMFIGFFVLGIIIPYISILFKVKNKYSVVRSTVVAVTVTIISFVVIIMYPEQYGVIDKLLSILVNENIAEIDRKVVFIFIGALLSLLSSTFGVITFVIALMMGVPFTKELRIKVPSA